MKAKKFRSVVFGLVIFGLLAGCVSCLLTSCGEQEAEASSAEPVVSSEEISGENSEGNSKESTVSGSEQTASEPEESVLSAKAENVLMISGEAGAGLLGLAEGEGTDDIGLLVINMHFAADADGHLYGADLTAGGKLYDVTGNKELLTLSDVPGFADSDAFRDKAAVFDLLVFGGKLWVSFFDGAVLQYSPESGDAVYHDGVVRLAAQEGWSCQGGIEVIGDRLLVHTGTHGYYTPDGEKAEVTPVETATDTEGQYKLSFGGITLTVENKGKSPYYHVLENGNLYESVDEGGKRTHTVYGKEGNPVLVVSVEAQINEQAADCDLTVGGKQVTKAVSYTLQIGETVLSDILAFEDFVGADGTPYFAVSNGDGIVICRGIAVQE